MWLCTGPFQDASEFMCRYDFLSFSILWSSLSGRGNIIFFIFVLFFCVFVVEFDSYFFFPSKMIWAENKKSPTEYKAIKSLPLPLLSFSPTFCSHRRTNSAILSKKYLAAGHGNSAKTLILEQFGLVIGCSAAIRPSLRSPKLRNEERVKGQLF